MSRFPQKLTQIEESIGRLKGEFEPPEDLAARVRASLASAPRRRTGRRVWALAGAVAVLAVAAIFLAQGRAPRVPLVAVVAARGPVSDGSGHRLAAGDRLMAGAAVVTGAKGRVTLVTRRGSEFTLAAESRLDLDRGGRRADLGKGRLYCRNRRHEFASISTVAGTIALLGTTVDADTTGQDEVAVTVVEGEVRLQNEHGEAVVSSGEKALLEASAAPREGEAVNTAAETAWYDGRGEVVSEAGEIAYLITRARGLASEVWAMRADGRGKHRVKSYTGGWWTHTGPWLPGSLSLLVKTGSLPWKDPDFARHQPRLAGRPILEAKYFGGREWVLDAATGRDAPFSLPVGYEAFYREFSPDGRWLAFSGRYQPDPKSLDDEEGGIWVYDLTTGLVKKVLSEGTSTPFSWSPDSRLLAVAVGYAYDLERPLVAIDVATGEVQDLHLAGASATFSPDGTRLAYCGAVGGTNARQQNVPMHGSVFVYDLQAGGEPRQVSPAEEGAVRPRWSPDGTRILYLLIRHDFTDDRHAYQLMAANADGSSVQEIYHGEGLLQAAEWAPSGESVYVVAWRVDPEGHLLEGTRISAVAADGSGQTTDLGGNLQDSVLSPAEQAQTTAAIADLREAVYQYEVGQIRSYEGKAPEAKAAFRAAADLFASIVWKHPLAGFGTADLAAYADQVDALASQSDAALLQHTCEWRMGDFMSWALLLYASRERRFPPDLATLEHWSLTHQWGLSIEWIDHTNTEWVKLIYRCPEGDRFVFHPTPNLAYPKPGDIIATCPNHPGCQLVWTESLAGMLRERLGIEANLAKARQK